MVNELYSVLMVMFLLFLKKMAKQEILPKLREFMKEIQNGHQMENGFLTSQTRLVRMKFLYRNRMATIPRCKLLREAMSINISLIGHSTVKNCSGRIIGNVYS